MYLSNILLVLCVFCGTGAGNDESSSDDVIGANSKRSDEVSMQSLQALVKQQSEQLQTVLAQMTAMKTELATTKDLVHQLRQKVSCVFCGDGTGNDESSSDDVIGANSKRSDDVSLESLQAVVQQQSEQLQTVLAQMTPMKTELVTTTSLVHQLQQRVAFTAYFTEGGPIDIGESSPIPFSHVTVNLGNGYDTRSGVFTAPVSGVYLFVLNAKGIATDSAAVKLDIVKANTVLYRAGLHSEAVHRARASASVTTHVNAGDKVFVKHEYGASIIDKWYDTAFSGILLYAD